MQGLHLTADLIGCDCDRALLTCAAMLADLCRQSVTDAGLTIVGETFHSFDRGGVTGVILLAESHLAVHTWPECGGGTIDAHVGNFSADNTAKAQAVLATLLQAFRPARQQLGRLQRGEMKPIPPSPTAPPPLEMGAPPAAGQSPFRGGSLAGSASCDEGAASDMKN